MSTPLALASVRDAAVVARVEDVTERGPVVSGPELGRQLARVAVFGDYRPRRGDQVLVLTDTHGNPYVVGVLLHLREAGPPPAKGVTLERADDGATVLRVADGDLRIEAEHGRVSIRGASGVEVESEQSVRVASRGRVELATEGATGAARSSLSMEGDAAQLKAGLFATHASRLYTLAEEMTWLASRLDARVDSLRQRASRIDIEAERIVESAKETYRTVEGLAQMTAGRLRLAAKSTFHVLAERAKMKARDVFAVDGERIYLG